MDLAPDLSIDQIGKLGLRFRRDILGLRRAVGDADQFDQMPRDGKLLLWLQEWDGKASIAFGELHPAYIEICRRIRLKGTPERYYSEDAPSAGTRISGAKELKGNTGDPWTPIDAAESKALSLGSDGFTYRKIVDLLDPKNSSFRCCR